MKWLLVSKVSSLSLERLHSDKDREFVNGIIRKLVKDWPGEFVIINGRPCNPKCQGLIEQGNQ